MGVEGAEVARSDPRGNRHVTAIEEVLVPHSEALSILVEDAHVNMNLPSAEAGGSNETSHNNVCRCLKCTRLGSGLPSLSAASGPAAFHFPSSKA